MQNQEQSPDPAPSSPPAAARHTSRRRLIATGAGGVAAVAALAPAAAQDFPLAGTWLATLVRENPPPGFPAIRFVYAFSSDGSLFADGPPTLLEASDRVFINAGQGAWRALGGRRYAFHFTSGAYDDTGAYRYTIVTAAEMTLAPTQDAWSGTYRRMDLMPDGSMLRRVPGTLSAVLIPVE